MLPMHSPVGKLCNDQSPSREGFQGLKRPNFGGPSCREAHHVLQLLWRYNREAVALRIQYLMTAKMGQESHTVLVRVVS